MRTPTWGILQRVGRSRLLALTILVPFLGTLILFNQQLVDLLTLSPQWVGSLIGQGNSDIERARAFTLSRLHFAYFGLSFLGIASLLFLLICPDEVRRFGLVGDYLAAEMPLITRAQYGLLVSQVSEDYILNSEGSNYTSRPTMLLPVGYPRDLERLFLVTLEEMFTRVSAEDAEVWPNEIYTALGRLNTYVIAEKLFAQRRAEIALWTPFHSVAGDFLRDLLRLKYLALDTSRPIWRMVITVTYGTGFSVLFWPTMVTFYLIFRRVLGF
jgi:hypothetical protein